MCANGMYKSHWEPLAEVHFDLASSEIHDDTYTYCLCSRVLISNIAEEQSDEDETPPEISPSKKDVTLIKFNEDVRQQFEGYENFNQFWSVNGENLVWKSWFGKYADYINPNYNKIEEIADIRIECEEASSEREDLDQELHFTSNNYYSHKDSLDKDIELDLDLPAPRSPQSVQGDEANSVHSGGRNEEMEQRRERKFSYDSKTRKNYKNMKINDNFKRRSESDLSKNQEKKLTVRNIQTDGRSVDSMTNITRLSISSFLSTDFDEVKESPVNDALAMPMHLAADNSELYWKRIWDEHLYEMYERYYAMFINWYGQQKLTNYDEINSSNYFKSNISDLSKTCDNTSFKDTHANDRHFKSRNRRSRSKKQSRKVIDSVGTLLNTLLSLKGDEGVCAKESDSGSTSDSIEMNDEIFDSPEVGSEGHNKTGEGNVQNDAGMLNTLNGTTHQTTSSNSIYNNSSDDDDEKKPFEKRDFKVKRSHETEFDDIRARVKKTFCEIGLRFGKTSAKRSKIKRLSHNSSFGEHLSSDEEGKETVDDLSVPLDQEMSDEASDIPSEVAWRRRRIKKICRPKRKDERKLSLKPTHVYFSDSNDGDDDEEKLKAVSVVVECDSIDLSSEVEDPTVREATKIVQIECSPAPIIPTAVDDKSGHHKRLRRKKKQHTLPPEIEADESLVKYWKKRRSLFSLFDRGIRLDMESWFSVTPEAIAAHTASRLATHTVVDGFCGAGGNTIQLAMTCQLVLACDLDPKKIELAEHNSSIYGVRDKIQFIVGDFFQLAPTLKADAVFLSPPWGGPQYVQSEIYNLETMLQPAGASQLLAAARTISNEVALYLPRNTDTKQLVKLAGVGGSVEIEQNYLRSHLVALTAYFGNLVCDTNDS